MRAEEFRLRWTAVMSDWNNQQLLGDNLVKEMLSALDPVPQLRRGPQANGPSRPPSQVGVASKGETGDNVAEVSHAPED